MAHNTPPHHNALGDFLNQTASSKPAQIGALPIVVAVPTAIPVAFTPAKKARLYSPMHTPAPTTNPQYKWRCAATCCPSALVVAVFLAWR
ncbi:hypothetical protein D3C75_1065690 [compost metagenome]